ncbi:MAG: phytase, partial [Acidimicrobiia bacterium]
MGGDKGASGVEYLLLATAAAVLVIGVASRLAPGIGSGTAASLAQEGTTTTTVAVLGEVAIRGGAGDAAVWVPAGGEPLILAARPGEGLVLLDAARRLLDSVPLEAIAGVDVRQGAGDGSGSSALVVVGDGSRMRAYRLDAPAYRFRELAGPLPADLTVAGLCLYRSPATDSVSVFPFDRQGRMVQWELTMSAGRPLTAHRVRSIDVGGPVTACAADDANGAVFVSESGVGLRRLPAEPGSSEATLIDRIGAGGGLVAGVDALAVIDTAEGPGWILASSESDETFSFYRRDAGHEPAGRFPASDRVDHCHDTTGIDAAGGFLVCQG